MLTQGLAGGVIEGAFGQFIFGQMYALRPKYFTLAWLSLLSF